MSSSCSKVSTGEEAGSRSSRDQRQQQAVCATKALKQAENWLKRTITPRKYHIMKQTTKTSLPFLHPIGFAKTG